MSAPLAAQHDGRIRALTPRPEAFLRRLAGRPLFACAVASTDTAEIPGISAAGETPEKRRYTAALDAEFLLLVRPVTLPEIPKNPLGPPSPVVITRAALAALDLEALIIDAGIRVAPQTPRLVLGGAPGRFGGSAIPNLCRYEEGLVKEGVGAGAAAFAAFLGGWSHADLLGRIEGVVRGL